MGILRPNLLDGVSVVLDTVGEPAWPGLEAELRGLGAGVDRLSDGAWPEGLPLPDEAGALVVDCTGWEPDHGQADSGVEPLRSLLDRVWMTTEAVAARALIEGGRGGRLLFLAPVQRERFTVPAAVAALENLARTLSVEWARYGITAVVLAPSADTRPEDLSTVTAFLLSAAGAYFSGCRLDLG